MNPITIQQGHDMKVRLIIIYAEPRNGFRLIYLSSERTMLVAERFIITSSLINKFGKCPVSTDGGRTWYPPQAFQFLDVE
ncbi:MAG: hypothetical protein WBL88_10545, partial [Nitrososphaeraceae archaeon]